MNLGLVDALVFHGAEWLDKLAKLEPWDTVLSLEPEPRQMHNGEALDNALTVAADFIDLKSPYMNGHSRRCAELSSDAGRLLGFTGDALARLRRSALLHDFGTTAVPNSIWDKPARSRARSSIASSFDSSACGDMAPKTACAE